MAKHAKRFGVLTDIEAKVLGALYDNRNKFSSPFSAGIRQPGWMRSRDVRGAEGTSHALGRLADRGLVQRGPMPSNGHKSSWMYRVSDEGESIWLLFQDLLLHGGRRPSA